MYFGVRVRRLMNLIETELELGGVGYDYLTRLGFAIYEMLLSYG